MSAPKALGPKQVKTIAKALSAWFADHARDLPWRHTRDPYAIWVSEIMLQQTRVDTVENYWSKFIERFPTVEALATADQDAVLEQWSGLGYYRRARLLHRGAQYVHETLAGEVPSSADELRAIPGIGAYTAGAISSIAFDQPAPLVDGNVARVHSRLAAIEQPADQDAKAKHHWRFVEEVLVHGKPRVLAQALMELGATVCMPRSPTCLTCPVRRSCRAHAKGLEQTIPAAKKKKASPEFHFDALVIRRGDKILLERRPEEGLLAGMWCLPLVERAKPKSHDREALAAAGQARFGVALRLDEAPSTKRVKHVFSHRIWHVRPWTARASKAIKTKGRDDGRVLAWLAEGAEPEGGIPTLTRKLLRAID